MFGGERSAEDAGGLAVKRMGYALDIAQACDANKSKRLTVADPLQVAFASRLA